MEKTQIIEVQTFIKTHGPTVNIRNMREFPRILLVQVLNAFPGISSSVNRISFAVITALCWIGPDNAGPPPEEQWMCVVDKLNLYLPESEQEERVVEFVAAFGCGKWRSVHKGISTTWQHIWPGARKLMGDLAEIAISRDANPWLKNTVKGFPYMHKSDIKEYVHMFLEKFLLPEYDFFLKENNWLEIQSREEGALIKECDTVLQALSHGIKYVFSSTGTPAKGSTLPKSSTPAKGSALPKVSTPARVPKITIEKDSIPLPDLYPVVIYPNDNVVNVIIHKGMSRIIKKIKKNDSAFIYGPVTLKQWECHCGHYKCKERHRLSEWIPAIELCNYIFSAIKGPRVPIKTESFTKGMYFPCLTVDVQPGGGQLRYAKIEYKKCNACNTEYEGSVCVNELCRKPFNSFEDRKLVKEVLLMLHTDPALYTPHELYRCPGCYNMYDLTESLIVKYAHCAHCDEPLIKKEILAFLWKENPGLLMKVRILHREIQKISGCEKCGTKPEDIIWCPLYDNIPHNGHSFGYLPQRPTYVYSRVYYQLVSDHY